LKPEHIFAAVCGTASRKEFEKFEFPGNFNFRYSSRNGSNFFELLFWKNIGKDREFIFFELLKKCESKIGKDKTNLIIQKPDNSGQTTALWASHYSEIIYKEIKKRNIKMNYININFLPPKCDYETAIQSNINPFVIHRDLAIEHLRIVGDGRKPKRKMRLNISKQNQFLHRRSNQIVQKSVNPPLLKIAKIISKLSS
jgi:hypothetical protein